MNIAWVIPCRYVEVHDQLATIVGGGIDTYWVEELPATIQVCLAIRVTAMAEELGDDVHHEIVNRVRDPRGEVLHEVTGQLSIAGESARPEWLVGMTLPAIAQFQVPEEGTYTIETVIDIAEAQVPIHVVHGLPMGPSE